MPEQRTDKKRCFIITPKKILFCAVNKYEIGELQEIIHEQDPNAFVTFFVGPLIHGGFEKRL